MAEIRKVLVVDDAPFIREIVKHIIANEEGLELIGEASNGEEAIEKAKELVPDVILMDIVMPLKSGIQATEEILKILPNIKVISCSTLDKDLLADKAKNAGCQDHIQKPFKSSELIKALKNS